ncbi:MAG: hypothetical protein JJU46_11145 [Balneolaceae bacterium]|nr:hypothetical protein [Balneolaceae bacterium]MCH8547884.1 hypothetical protein [Balneolaceae bacterium]
MKKKLQSGIIPIVMAFALLFSLTGVKSAQAQFSDTGEIIRAGASDANLLLKEYLRPFGNGFGADLNSGWVNSPRPYRTLGFDLRVSASVAFVPTGDRSFDVTGINFENLEPAPGTNPISQTLFGDDVAGPEMRVMGTNPFTNQREEITRFTMPEGTGYPYVPAPMIQLTVGAIMDTDVSIRYSPTITLDDFTVDLFGIGVRHGLNQWIPNGSLLPVDLSVQLGYTRLTSDYRVDLRPEEGSDIYNPFSGQPQLWDDQKIDFVSEGITGNLLVGKRFPIISFYGGVGFQTSNVSINSPGAYPITGFNPDFDPTSTSEETRQRKIERLDDPINLDYTAENSVHAMAGFRIRLAILSVTGSYTFSNYPVANLGVGISFR